MNDDEKRCSTCGETIHFTAKLCKHCKSHQDWRRFLSTSQTTLALLVALVSVIGTAGSTVMKAIRGEDSRLSATYQSFVDDKALFILVNTGTQPGSFSSPTFRVNFENADGDMHGSHALLAPTKSEQYVIEPSKGVGIQMRPTHSILADLPAEPLPEGTKMSCWLSMDLVEFSGKKGRFLTEVSCRRSLYTFWGNDGSTVAKRLLGPEP